MKKFLLWILTFSLSLAFVACGVNNQSTQSDMWENSSEITDDLEEDDSLSNDGESSTDSSEQDDSSIDNSGETSGDVSGDKESSSENDEWADIEFPRP